MKKRNFEEFYGLMCNYDVYLGFVSPLLFSPSFAREKKWEEGRGENVRFVDFTVYADYGRFYPPLCNHLPRPHLMSEPEKWKKVVLI